MTKPERGDKTYFKYRKNGAIIRFLIEVLVGLGIFLLGLLLNKFEIKNVFTIAAVLMVLPAAKTLVSIIILWPYKPMSTEETEMVDSLLGPGDAVFYNPVFTCAERPMHLDFIIVSGRQVIGFTTGKKDDVKIIDAYFKREFKNRHLNFVSFITDSEGQLISRIKMKSESGEFSSQQYKDFEEVKSFIKTAIV